MDKIERELKAIISKERKKRMAKLEKELDKMARELAKAKKKSATKAAYSNLNGGSHGR
jgi:hypothetical protein